MRRLSFVPIVLVFALSFGFSAAAVLDDPPGLVASVSAQAAPAEVSPALPYTATNADNATSPSADPLDDFGAFAQLVIVAVSTGNGWLLAALVLSLLVAALRRWGPTLLASRAPGLASWLTSDRGGAVLVLVLGILGGMVTGLLAGTPIGLPLILAALKVALSSAGGFVVLKKLLGSSKVEAAEVAGGQAVAAHPSSGAAGIVGTPARFGK